MAYIGVARHVERIPSGSTRGDRRVVGKENLRPLGYVHALPEGGRETACGQLVVGWLWEDTRQPWPPSFVGGDGPCPECRRIIREQQA